MRVTKRGIDIRIEIGQMGISTLQLRSNMIEKECDDGELVRSEENRLRTVFLSSFGVICKNNLLIVHRRQVPHLHTIDRSDPALRRERVVAGHRKADEFVVRRLQSQIARG